MEDMDTDINTRDELRSALDATKAQMEVVIREAAVGLWDWDVKTNTSYLSPEWKRQLGYEDHEIPNRHEEWVNRLHPDDRAHALEATARSLSAEESSYRIEFRLLHKNGSYRWIRSTGIVLRDDNGQPYRKVGCHIDITDLKETRDTADRQEAELRSQQARLLEQESRIAHLARVSCMSEMVGGIAHEICQPLQVISSLASVCEQAGSRSKESPQSLAQEITQQADRCIEIVQRLRNFVLRADRHVASTDVNRTVREALALTEYEARRRKCQIRSDFADDLRPLFADRIEIQQVVINLIRNAMDALVGRPDSCIWVGTRHEQAGVLLEVADNGPGVMVSVQDKLFEAFTSTKKEGMGLGLAISRTIVESFGGKIWVERRTGGGAHFYVWMPFERAMQQESSEPTG